MCVPPAADDEREGATMGIDREVIHTADAAAPGAHYAQGVRSGDLVFTAGHVGVDPASGTVVDGFEAQVHRAIQNVRATLRAAGCDLEDVVKTLCFVTRRSDFAALDPVYRTYFTRQPPARSTIVCALVREEFLFEIEAVARIP
jgi:2-iminobutanoate/2-iminopropanoate deaminase